MPGVLPEKHYDLILLDHRMPEVDGVDTLIHLKELFRRSGCETPVICHTAESARDNINLYQAAGFADVLLKPVDPEDLSRILMTYLPANTLDSIVTTGHRKSIESQLAILPVWLKSVPKLDLRSGLEHCGDAEDYLQSLEVFVSSVREKSEEIDNFCKSENWPMYSLRTHSLKSMAGLVGARELADEAAKLEYLSRQGETYDLPALTKTILFVEGTHGMVNKGIIKRLEEAGFRMIRVFRLPTGSCWKCFRNNT